MIFALYEEDPDDEKQNILITYLVRAFGKYINYICTFSNIIQRVGCGSRKRASSADEDVTGRWIKGEFVVQLYTSRVGLCYCFLFYLDLPVT